MNYRLCIGAILIVLAAGCSKNGVTINETSGAVINFYNCTVDPITFQVGINDELQLPFLTNGNSWAKFIVLSEDSLSVRLRAEALPQREVLSAVSYHPALGKKQQHYFTIYQSKTGEKPFLVLPDTSTDVSKKEGARLQFTYRTDLLSDSLKVKFYYAKNTSPVDSCVVTKRTFSGWLALPLLSNDVFEYEISDAKTAKTLLEKSTFPVKRQDISLDYNVLFIDKDGFGNISASRLY